MEPERAPCLDCRCQPGAQLSALDGTEDHPALDPTCPLPTIVLSAFYQCAALNNFVLEFKWHWSYFSALCSRWDHLTQPTCQLPTKVKSTFYLCATFNFSFSFQVHMALVTIFSCWDRGPSNVGPYLPSAHHG